MSLAVSIVTVEVFDKACRLLWDFSPGSSGNRRNKVPAQL